MAYERNPNEPFSSADDEYRRSARLDNELQPDPELAEGPASGGRVAMFAIAVAVILGAVFYGLNNSSINQASTAPPATTATEAPFGVDFGQQSTAFKLPALIPIVLIYATSHQ